ncbi:MAG: hypothetical protein ACKO3W_08010, partial [bacterium]
MNDRSTTRTAPSRHEPNLVPVEITARVARIRASRTLNRVGGSVLASAALLFAGATWMDGRSAELARVAHEQGTPVVRIEQEIAALAGERSEITARLDAQRAVGVAIPASGVVRAIASSLPQGTLLDRLALEYANVQGVVRKGRRGAKDVVPPREMRGEIAGIATDESDVGRIVDAIGALAPVERVALESSRSREFLGRHVREFRVTFT